VVDRYDYQNENKVELEISNCSFCSVLRIGKSDVNGFVFYLLIEV